MFECPYKEKCMKDMENAKEKNCSQDCIILLHYKTDEKGTNAVKDFIKSDLFNKFNKIKNM